jgi:UDP-2,3-diacylglucosamine hydrolase
MATLFIADLHLSPTRPAIVDAFADFLRGPARAAEALYVLGDLFDYWLGDDQLSEPFAAQIAGALAALSRAGVRICVQHGNRDFLLDGQFEQRSGATLLPEYHLAELYGTRTLLTHGDQLCTDDVSYQAFRTTVRDRAWQQEFLALPLAERRVRAAQVREASDLAKAEKARAIMDANADAIAICLRQHGYPRLIHGHTHRPARHEHQVDGHVCERYVLADWYQRASYLECDAAGCRALPRIL